MTADRDYIDLEALRWRQRPRRFELLPFDKIAIAPGRNYLVKGLVPREGLVVVWGPPKCGKTFLIYDMMMHVARNLPTIGDVVSPTVL